jgi:hypothetical protein
MTKKEKLWRKAQQSPQNLTFKEKDGKAKVYQVQQFIKCQQEE